MTLDTLAMASPLPADARPSPLVAVDGATLDVVPWLAGALALALAVGAVVVRRRRRRRVRILARPRRPPWLPEKKRASAIFSS